MHYLSLLNSFVINFLLLLLFSYLIRQHLRETYSATGAGGIVMALTLFGFIMMPHLPEKYRFLVSYLTLESLIIWLFIAESYMKCYLDGHFYIHTKAMLNRFCIGTWAVSSAVLSLLWIQTFKTWNEIAWVLALIAIILWIAYSRIAVSDIRVLLKNHLTVKLNGNVFLLTVSTQSTVLLLSVILGSWFPWPIAFSLVVLGFVSYGVSLFLVLRYYSQIRSRHIVSDWSAANCLIHGGLSISGLACVTIGMIPARAIILIWFISLIVFLFIEGINFLRFVIRTRKVGLKMAIFSYDVLQWLHPFSYGLLYAFTSAILVMQTGQLKLISLLIITYCQYIVLAMLLFQSLIFLKAKYKPSLIKSELSLQKRKR